MVTQPVIPTPRIAVGIMCYTPSASRVERAGRLMALFESAGMVVKRFDSDGTVSCGENARRAWSWCASTTAPYCAVIADDAEPCEGAAWAMDRLSRLRSHHVMTFMDWTNASERAKAVGSNWLVGGGIYGPASMMPASTVRGMLAFLTVYLEGGEWIPNADDYTIGLWLKYGYREPLRVYTPVPCLFQHAEPSASTLGHNNKSRVCRWMIGDPGAPKSAYDVDWLNGLDEPVRSDSQPFDPKTALSYYKGPQ